MSQRTIIVKANSIAAENVSGKVFAIISSTAPVDVALGADDKITLSSGRKLTGDKFKRITFYETSGSDNTIVYYAGDDDITLPNVISSSDSSSTNAVLSNTLANCVAATHSVIIKTVPASGTPVPWAAVATYFRQAVIKAKPSRAKSAANTDTVFFGAESGADQQPFDLAPGDVFVLEAPPGAKYNAANWYVDANVNGEGVVITLS